MRFSILAGTIVSAMLFNGSAQAAPHQVLSCPADIRAEVTSPLPPDWVATAQSSTPAAVTIEQIGGENALVCKYLMFGTDYIVWRRPPAGWTNCGANTIGRYFYCYEG